MSSGIGYNGMFGIGVSDTLIIHGEAKFHKCKRTPIKDIPFYVIN